MTPRERIKNLVVSMRKEAETMAGEQKADHLQWAARAEFAEPRLSDKDCKELVDSWQDERRSS